MTSVRDALLSFVDNDETCKDEIKKSISQGTLDYQSTCDYVHWKAS